MIFASAATNCSLCSLVPSKPQGPCQTGVDHELVASFYLYQCIAVYSSERNEIKSEDLVLSTVSKSFLFKKCLGVICSGLIKIW